MFIITRGSVQVTIEGEDNKEIPVKERGPGDFFGEMSLLTGEPRSANVIAKNDVEVIVLNKAAFTDILMKDPEILELLVDILETQKAGLESALAKEKEKKKSQTKPGRAVLLSRIKNYFGLS